jgi:hypothetical protein
MIKITAHFLAFLQQDEKCRAGFKTFDMKVFEGEGNVPRQVFNSLLVILTERRNTICISNDSSETFLRKAYY